MKWVMVIFFMTIFFVSLLFSVTQRTKTIQFQPSESEQVKRDVYVGAWVSGFYDNETKKLTTSTLTDFEKAINKKMAIATIYSEWSYLSNKNLLLTLNELSGHGWVPMISANPYFFEECESEQESLYKAIADGECDTFLREASNNLKSYNKPIFFRFAWEMNLPDMYWSVSSAKSTPQEFVAAWRHFHTIMQEENAENVIWVLSFNTSNSNTIPYKDLFPGNDYIDWVAIDGYNWGNTHPWAGWANFNGVFRNSYNELTALTDKPIMLSEVNSAPTGTGGDKAQWLTDMLSEQVPTHFPNIRAVVFFNEDKTEGELVDWRMEKSPQYLYVLNRELGNELYRSDYP